ncbi:MAG TPA: chemotaxis response regulator protein-glutamate methylesterase [Xanthobacteraceae bacterium]|jgi:two-component system chemotaxis response regulator CheB|nr:chemotaxis response regulator protein-glutamate methylesterase [Xanthobacteraceae bacterium]
MSTVLAATPSAFRAEHPIRVMVVDDAVVVRSLLARWVDGEPDMQTVASLRTGREAVARIDKGDIDVVILDIDMPELDGIAALPMLLQKKRDLTVIMVSTLTRRSAEISLRALALGAADYIPKPETARETTTSESFRREFIEKIRTLGRGRPTLRAFARAPAPVVPLPEKAPPALRSRRSPLFPPEAGAVQLRPFAITTPRALVIGSSTGGPQALSVVVEKLAAAIDRAPVLIAQHMPPTFTTVLAEHLSRIGGRGAHEAEHGEPVLAGGIYVAPGGKHMRVVRSTEGGVKIVLGDDPPINFCKPAVDALFTSAAEVWGPGSLALVLTGMGADGTCGAGDIVKAGGSVIAQDEASSVVWGMPRAVAQAGLCSAVLPLDQIALKIVRLFSGDRA